MAVNLLPWRISYRHNCKLQFYRQLYFSLALAIVFWLGDLLWNVHDIYVQAQKIVILRQAIAKIDREFSQAKEILDYYQANKKSLRTLELLKLISQKMPDSLYLTSLESKEDRVYISGKAASQENLAQLLRVINQAHGHEKILLAANNHLDDKGQLDFNLIYNLSEFSD